MTSSQRDPGLRPPAPAKVVFVSYGGFDCNSARHISGFANALVARGHEVSVCAVGPVTEAYCDGPPDFEFFEIGDLQRAPEAVLGLNGQVRPDETVLVCWTPREIARRAVAPLIERFGLRYVVHMEDNEQHLTEVYLSQKRRRLWRRGSAFPKFLTDPHHLEAFLKGAAGLTVIEERILEIVPTGPQRLVLEPGVELGRFGSALKPPRERTIRRAMGVPDGAPMLLYPGNLHFANVEEVKQLYEALTILRTRSPDLTLVRTGRDGPPDRSMAQRLASQAGVVSLGVVDRSFLIDLMKCADVLVQPGAPGPFNDYRLPSKVPEFMAAGKPIVLPATNVGARLRHGKDAMLLKEGSAAEIAAHVETVLSRPTLAATLGANARAFADRCYNWDVQATKLADFLRQVSATGSASPTGRYGDSQSSDGTALRTRSRKGALT